MNAVIQTTGQNQYTLVSSSTRTRIALRIMRDHDVGWKRALAIFDATLGFLALCASHPGQRLAPSKEVDKGWHAFLLYTKEYRNYCRTIGREFIDHEPNDGSRKHAGTYAATIALMERARIPYDKELWPTPNVCSATLSDCDANDCTAEDCYQGDDD